MSVSVLYMSMSLDGYIADLNDQLGGDDGTRLHQWSVTPDGEFFRPAGPAGALMDELNATGAVLVGHRLHSRLEFKSQLFKGFFRGSRIVRAGNAA